MAVVGIVIVATAAGWLLFREDAAGDQNALTSTVNSEGCDDVGVQPIELNRQVVDAPERFCIVVTEPSEVTVGAAAVESSDPIRLELFDAAENLLATADSAPSDDPQITQLLVPGAYLAVVSSAAQTTPEFLVYTAVYASASAAPSAPAVAPAGLPARAQCGSDDVPWVSSPVRIGREDRAPYVCLRVEDADWAKIGLESGDEGNEGPDLRLSVFAYDADGAASLLKSVDDSFGYDPEMSIDLAPGDYLIEVGAWNEDTIGSPELYLDTEGSFFRRGKVSPQAAALTPQACEGAVQAWNTATQTGADAVQGEGAIAVLDPDSTLSVRTELPLLCLEVPQQQRLTLEAATLTDQDLSIEVIGFEADGTPYRFAWTDENPYSEVLGATDPLLDLTFPAGRYTVEVSTYYGEPAAEYDVRFVPSTPRR